MATETHGQDQNAQEIAVHARNYAGFLNLLKWSMVVVAIVAATVIYIISN